MNYVIGKPKVENWTRAVFIEDVGWVTSHTINFGVTGYTAKIDGKWDFRPDEANIAHIVNRGDLKFV